MMGKELRGRRMTEKGVWREDGRGGELEIC